LWDEQNLLLAKSFVGLLPLQMKPGPASVAAPEIFCRCDCKRSTRGIPFEAFDGKARQIARITLKVFCSA